MSNECEAFKQDEIRYEVASVSCAYDPVLFCDLLDDNIALSKFSTAFGNTTASPKDPDIVMYLWESTKILAVNLLAQLTTSLIPLLAQYMLKRRKELMPNYFKRFGGSNQRQQSVPSIQQLN